MSSVELVADCLARITAVNESLGAFVRTYSESALAEARIADVRLSREGDQAPLLCGIPIALKDLIAVAGRCLTLGVDGWDGFVPKRNAVVWQRLKADGAVLVGHTSSHELAFGSITPQASNPWDPARSPGGSSGGSAAAVAAGMVPVAIGTDTGGSLRNPASMCGIATIKPTAGLVNMHGISPLAPSMDTVGPLAVDITEAMDVFRSLLPAPSDLDRDGSRQAISSLGRHEADSPSPLAGVRIGYPRGDWFDDDLEPGIARLWEKFLERLAALRAELVEVDPPAVPCFHDMPLNEVIIGFEFVARYDDLERLGGPPLSSSSSMALDRLRQVQISQADYLEAQAHRVRLKQAFRQMFSRFEISTLVLPALSIEPPPRVPPSTEMPSIGRNLRAVFNLTGQPVVAVPMGLSHETGMPGGVQFVGPERTEEKLVEIASCYQVAFPVKQEGRFSERLSNRFNHLVAGVPGSET